MTKSCDSLQNFLSQMIKHKWRNPFSSDHSLFAAYFLKLRIFLVMLDNVEWCAIPCNGISYNRFEDLVWAEKWRRRAEPTCTLQIHLMIINTWLSYFSEESVQFFHPEGQRKLQSKWLLVWSGQNRKERKIVRVSMREAEQLSFCILTAAENDQHFCGRLRGHISHYCGVGRRQNT